MKVRTERKEKVLSRVRGGKNGLALRAFWLLFYRKLTRDLVNTLSRALQTSEVAL